MNYSLHKVGAFGGNIEAVIGNADPLTTEPKEVGKEGKDRLFAVMSAASQTDAKVYIVGTSPAGEKTVAQEYTGKTPREHFDNAAKAVDVVEAAVDGRLIRKARRQERGFDR